MRQPGILTQSMSDLHPMRPEYPESVYGPWLHPVLGDPPP